MTESPLSVIQFWRDEVHPARWFAEDAALDKQIRDRFESLWRSARDGGLDAWQETPEGALALVIVLDQFPRNMFRGLAEAFATDATARAVAGRALDAGFDRRVPTVLRPFLYLPYMHSEDMADQDRSVAYIAERVGKDSINYPFALQHRATIARFGRFPARNAALGRVTTREETEFLNKG
ncbi:MAG: DUF924 domain-containing protein [Proteobacteria bacterium]|nr:DUF924 domain-containing protein [Pseudomonadota bacterium]